MNADAYGDALDGALREIDRLSRVNETLLNTLSAVGEHLRSGIRLNYDPETGAQDYASAWDHEADALVGTVQQVLAEFSTVARASKAHGASPVNPAS